MESEIEIEIPCPIQALLAQFQKVFNVQVGLPPRRSHDHAITLHSRTSPVNIRPYRYPQIQKGEIECLVKEMLAAGIIQLSTSPFSSPVLLVRKKEGG